MSEELVKPETSALDVARAGQVDGRIDEILRDEARAMEIRGRRGAELGRLLQQVQADRLFEALGFKNYTDWLKAKKEKFGLEYPWLYAYKSAAERLLPYLKEEVFDQIGITKANELAKMVKVTGKRPDGAIVEMARAPETTVKQLRVEIAQKMNAPQDSRGQWLDLGGFYATADERKLIERMFDVAKRTDPVVPKEWPTWMQLKECLVGRIAPDFLAGAEEQVTERVEGRIPKREVA